MSNEGFSQNSTQKPQASAAASAGSSQSNYSDRNVDPIVNVGAGISGLKSMTKTGNLAGFSNDSLDKVYKAAEAVLKSSGTDQIDGSISIVKLNHRQQGEGYLSSILMVMVKDTLRATHALILEGTDRLEPIRIRNGNDVTSIPRPAGDVYCKETEDHYRDVSLQAVIQTAGKENTVGKVFVAAGGTLIPTELTALTADELISSPIFNDLIYKAKNALIVNVDLKADNAIILPLEAMCNKDNSLVYEAIVENRPSIAKVDACGLPVRCDIEVTVEAREKTARNQDRIQNETVAVSKASIAVELEYLGEDAMRRVLGAHERDNVTQRYLPRFILTSSSTDFQFDSVQTDMLALYSATLVAGDNRWYGAFNPTYSDKKDLNAIGAVGYECTHLEATDGRPAFLNPKSTDDLVDLIENTVADYSSFSIDVDMTAPDGWISAAYLAEAQGVRGAHNYILSELNKVTNNRFAEDFKGGTMFVDDNVVVPRGYVITPDGNIDLRSIGTLGILNLVGEESISTVEEYCSLFVANGEDPLVRVNRAIEQIKNIFGPNNVVVKGYWRRITATAEFIDALTRSIFNTGYDPVAAESPFVRYVSRRERSSVHDTARRASGSFGSNRNYGNSNSRRGYNMYNR